MRRTSSRCQRSNVRGVTTRPTRRDRGRSRVSAANNARSAGLSLGRGCCRRNTTISWRNTSSSTSFASSERRPVGAGNSVYGSKSWIPRRNRSFETLQAYIRGRRASRSRGWRAGATTRIPDCIFRFRSTRITRDASARRPEREPFKKSWPCKSNSVCLSPSSRAPHASTSSGTRPGSWHTGPDNHPTPLRRPRAARSEERAFDQFEGAAVIDPPRPSADTRADKVGGEVTRIPDFHTNSPEYPPSHRNVYHDQSGCKYGKEIKLPHRLSGQGGRPRCDECKRLG